MPNDPKKPSGSRPDYQAPLYDRNDYRSSDHVGHTNPRLLEEQLKHDAQQRAADRERKGHDDQER